MKKREWLEAFFYIFNLRWNEIDNFRIDKYLMCVRFQLNALLTFLRDEHYSPSLLKWYHKLMLGLFTQPKLADAATGIPLQICDVLVEEMNKVDKGANMEAIAGMLSPYLSALGVMENKELKERVVNKIFSPLMETNKTKVAESSDDEEEMEKKEKHHRLVDGGKMPPKTVKEIN